MDQLSSSGSQRCAHHHPGQFHKLATDTPAEEERVLLKMVMDCARFCELTGSLAGLLFKKHSWRRRRRTTTTTTITTTTTTREEITSTAATKRKAHQTISMMKTEFFQSGNSWKLEQLRWLLGFRWYCCCCCALSFLLHLLVGFGISANCWSPLERGRSGGGETAYLAQNTRHVPNQRAKRHTTRLHKQ